ncbi:O-antigen ligase domain-containing protein, partial [bacterium]|nr:O-antigen ligase domain-containing protein [bacterium]
LCVALLMYVCHRFPGSSRWGYKVGTVLFCALIFYAQYLSFSRATWVGFVLAMPFFYLFLFRLIPLHRPRLMLADSLSALLGLFVFSLYYVFEFHKMAPMVGILFFVVCVSCLTVWWVATRLYEGESLLALLSLYVGAVYKGEWTGMKQLALVAIQTIAILVPLVLTRYFSVSFRRFVLRLFVILAFFKLQYMVLSFSNVWGELCVIGGVFYLLFSDPNEEGREQKRWSFAVLASFFLVVLLPALPGLLASLSPPDPKDKTTELLAMDNVRGRVKGLKADSGSARVSMWKSSVQWTLDHWWLGTGLDTIKYMYPIYRRSDYGILEGGHNFTPDRLHNEYLNNFATRGVLATFIYYGGIILGWLLLVLKALPRLSRSPYRFFSLALMTGGLIYLGQVMFNFGVVATMVLFYLCVGASWAISIYPDFECSDQDPSSSHDKTSH